MKALSIRHPFAWLIVNGFKDIENRSTLKNFRGEFLIHAGKEKDKKVDLGKIRSLMMNEKAFNQMMEELYIQERGDRFGGIVGQAEIVNCIHSSHSPWFEGPNGFVLKNQKVLPFMRCRGQLGFFEVDI